MSYLIDTCVISELIKAKPHLGVIEWFNKVDENLLFLSVITIGELEKGISKLGLNESNKRSKIEKWFKKDLIPRFENRIIPIDSEIALKWGLVLGENEKNGIKIPVLDGLIGATALVHNLTVVTRNVEDINFTGALIINPWKT